MEGYGWEWDEFKSEVFKWEEYINDDFKWYCTKNGVKMTKTILGKPQ